MAAGGVDPGPDRRRMARVEYRDGLLPPTVRVRPGRDVVVVNLSSMGLLVEGVWRLRPNSAVDLLIAFGPAPLGIRGRVLRCYVSAIDRLEGVRYRSAIALHTPIEIAAPPDLDDLAGWIGTA